MAPAKHKQMNQIFSGVMVGAMVSLGVAIAAGSAIAQTNGTDLDPLEGLGSTSTSEGESVFGSTDGPFELIHRAILAPSMSSQEFQQYQQQTLGNEAEAFRIRQQEALRQMQNSDPAATDALLIEGESL